MTFAYLLPLITFLFQFEEISHDLQTTTVRFGGSVWKLRSGDARLGSHHALHRPPAVARSLSATMPMSIVNTNVPRTSMPEGL